MAKMEKLRMGDFLTSDAVQEAIKAAGVAIFKIETEPELRKSEEFDTTRYVCSGELYMTKNKKQAVKKTWTMNMTSSDFLIEKFGEDSKDFVGKEVELELIRQSTPKGMKNVIYPVGAVKEEE